MATTTDAIISETYAIKEQLGDYADVTTSLKRFASGVKPMHHSRKIIKSTIGFGSFILGSSVYGVLGTDKLGRGGHTEELYALIPNNNLFVEYFHEDQYIDSLSGGTLGQDSNGKEIYTLNEHQILQSEIIFKPRQPITKAKMVCPDLTTDDSYVLFELSTDLDLRSGGNAEIEFSNDGGSTWVQADSNLEAEFSTSSVDDELKYRITANDNLVITNQIQVSATLG